MGVFGTDVRFLFSWLQPSTRFWRFGWADAGLSSSSIVTFRMVVFRPFVSEVILAKVKSSDEDGIRRTLVLLLTCILST
jgi:hypothetical protein